MPKKDINPRGKANFSLGNDYLDLLETIADDTQIKKSAVLRILIDIGAERLGLEPINKVPKSLAPMG